MASLKALTLASVAVLALTRFATAADLLPPPPELPPRRPPFATIDLTDQLNDFADTAALLTHLDLLVTIDTAVAHLAGALGREVWTFIPYIPDWRWELAGDKTFWYPTMRLFRQSIRNDWPGPISRMRDELSKRVSHRERV